MNYTKIKMRDPKFRTDIDGLRAIAVLAVIIFHINHDFLPAGFIGVDIFFVISGYLISLHILNEMDSNCFSFKEFYRKRIKRILPAVTLVIGVTLILSQLFMTPIDAQNVSTTATFALFSSANIYFWKFSDNSYFSSSSEEVPLLHLWSLGIEEQFYLFWPIIIFLLYKKMRPSWFITLIISAILISTLLGELLYVRSQPFVYYMLPARAGELLVGAVVAYLHRDTSNFSLTTFASKILTYTGVAILIISFSYIDKGSPFPGVNALIPSFSIGLIILGGFAYTGLIQQFLSIKPLQWVGSVSYSAYLWHWPILAFYRYAYGQPTLFSACLIFIATFIVAWISYIWVENKFRYLKYDFKNVFIKLFLLPTLVLLFFAIATLNTNNHFFKSNNYNESFKVLDNKIIPPNKYPYVCQKWELTEKDVNNKHCIIGKNKTTKTLLWGDSNAAHYIGILGVFAQQLNSSFRNFSHASCPPLISNPTSALKSTKVEECKKSQLVVSNELSKYDNLIIGASHTDYADNSDDYLTDFSSMVLNLSQSKKAILLLGKAPVFENFNRNCMKRSLSIPYMNCENVAAPISKKIQLMNNKLKELASLKDNIYYFDVNSYLCPHDICSPYGKTSEVLYFDSSHIEMKASWRIGQDIYNNKSMPKLMYKVFN